jgi:Phytochelatin synthase
VPGRRSAAQLRAAAKRLLDLPRHCVLVNFSLTTLTHDDMGGGHFSPLAASNGPPAISLLTGVAHHKYLPFWLDTDLL